MEIPVVRGAAVTQRNEKLTAGILAIVLVLMSLTLERSYNAVTRASDAEEAACEVSRTLGEHMARQEEREKYMMETLGRIEENVKAIHNGNK